MVWRADERKRRHRHPSRAPHQPQQTNHKQLSHSRKVIDSRLTQSSQLGLGPSLANTRSRPSGPGPTLGNDRSQPSCADRSLGNDRSQPSGLARSVGNDRSQASRLGWSVAEHVPQPSGLDRTLKNSNGLHFGLNSGIITRYYRCRYPAATRLAARQPVPAPIATPIPLQRTAARTPGRTHCTIGSSAGPNAITPLHR